MCSPSTCDQRHGVCVDGVCRCGDMFYGSGCRRDLAHTPLGITLVLLMAAVVVLLLRHMVLRVWHSVRSGESTHTPTFAAVVMAILGTVARLVFVLAYLSADGGTFGFIAAVVYLTLLSHAYIMIARSVYVSAHTRAGDVPRAHSPAVVFALLVVWACGVGQMVLVAQNNESAAIMLNSAATLMLMFLVQLPIVVSVPRVRRVLQMFPDTNGHLLNKLSLLMRQLSFVAAVTIVLMILMFLARPSAQTMGYGVFAVVAARLWYQLAFPFIVFRMWEPRGQQTRTKDWLLPCVRPAKPVDKGRRQVFVRRVSLGRIRESPSIDHRRR